MPKKEKPIILYRTKHCPRCHEAANTLRAVLKEKNLDYEKLVQEKFVEDKSVVDELQKIGIESAPTIRIGRNTIVEDEPTNENCVRQLLEQSGF